MKRICIAQVGDCELRVELGIALFSLILIIVLTYGMFPYYFRDLSQPVYWWMGLVGFAGFVFSLLVHEAAHIAAARHLGIVVVSVTLFPFGGVMESEPGGVSVGREMWTALIGPAFSIVFACGTYLLYVLGKEWLWSVPTIGILVFLCYTNILIVAMNLLPVCPFDGGKVLKAALVALTGSYHYAALVCGAAGAVFSLFVMLSGIAFVLQGVLAGGIWWILIAVSVLHASELELQRYCWRGYVGDLRVGMFMCRSPVSVSAHFSLSSVITGHLLGCGQCYFPVLGNGNELVGGFSASAVMAVPEGEWDQLSVGEIVEPCSELNCVRVDELCMELLGKMCQGGRSSSMVVDSQGKLLGLVTLRDIVLGVQEKLC